MSVNDIFLGIDIGSISAKFAVLDGKTNILETQYHRHKGQPLLVVRRVMGEILNKYGLENIKQIGLCGSGGELAGKLLGGATINEIIAHSQAVIRLYPQVRTIIEIGGEDSKLILLDDKGNIQDFAMNAICAAGTGSFLDQQASRLGISIEEEFGTLALKSVHPPRIAGRCSVFAKTDMIHLQQEATPVWDIVSGLCHAMARSFKSNLGRGKEFQPVVAFQGGVAANKGMVRAFENVLELPPGDLLIPKDFACMGAIGAAMVAMKQEPVKFVGLEQLEKYIHDRAYQPEGRAPLSSFNPPVRHDFKPLEDAGSKIEAYMGVDIGSVSTNVVVIDKNRKVLSKHYLMTAGRPIEAVRQGIARAGQELGQQVEIMGVGTTGSGRYMIADLIGADIVKNEITAQARAAMEIDPQVDTIFEIGGQDSKYISIDQGVIVDFEMNKVCAAGTGSFLEEQAERLGVNIKAEFGKLALSAQSPVHLGERCTVFMESDLNHHQQKGAAQDSLVAGLAYSIVYNYLNRVVGDRKIGNRIFFQGGVAYNDGVVAAFEQVTGKPIHVPEHHEVTGALGVAIIAQEKRAWEKSKFKGFSFGERSYQLESFQCQDCSNHCEIRKVSVEGEEPLFYGSRCDKYELREERRKSDLPDLFKERERMLLNAYQSKPLPANAKTVGIPRCLFVYEQYPFWQAFFGELGFKVVLSRKTTKEIIQRGIEQVAAETCFPIKLAHGHVMALLEQGIDYLFLPSIISPEPNTPDGLNSFSCPYVQAIPYTIAAAINIPDKVKQLKPIIRYSYGVKHVIREMVKMSEQLGRSPFEIKMAFETARKTQAKFYADIRRRGAEALASLKPDQMGVVIISRPYNGCDRGLNLELPHKLLDLGFIAIPLDFLPIDQTASEGDWPNMYWRYGKYILRAADIIKEYPQLYPLYITNFGCGPDSFITHFFRRKIGSKPCLQIEVDEHSADVGAITRCEAFKDSLENMQKKHITLAPKIKGTFRLPKSSERNLYIPHMCDHAKTIAAAFRREGIAAEVLPESDSETLVWGRKYTSGRECYPCIVTTGDIIKATRQPGFDPEKAAFFMPSGAGPCRFGQYNMFQRMVLDDLNLDNVPIFNPNQDHNLLQEFGVVGDGFIRNAWQGTIAVDFMDQFRRETRPYEVNPGQTDRVYAECLEEVCQAIEQDRLWPTMEAVRQKLADIPVQRNGYRPVIGIVGEIFVRTNRFCNLDIARQIEQLGGEAWFTPFSEWMLYLNHTAKGISRATRSYKSLFNLKLNNWVQLKDEHRMQGIFRGSLCNLEEPPITTTLEYSSKYLDESIEGEAVLSIGKSVDFARKGLAGIINTIPFTCMPGTIVTAITKRLREDYHGIPCLNMSLDGLEQSNIRTRLEAFMYQARQYHEKRQG